MRITDQTPLAPVISVFFPIEWIVVPEPIVEGKNSLDTRLDDRTATGKTRKLGDVDRSPFYCDAYASRVDNRILFGVADDLYFLVSIIEDLSIVIRPSGILRQPRKLSCRNSTCNAWNETNRDCRFTKKITRGAIQPPTSCKACARTAMVRSS